ncbi:MAG: hypothetical protein K0R48_1087 [Gammaproteobacteria bacterium]|jgi:hypothetical protein|nr:hypothetical protein [Gammaproteobacteria bacterium]
MVASIACNRKYLSRDGEGVDNPSRDRQGAVKYPNRDGWKAPKPRPEGPARKTIHILYKITPVYRGCCHKNVALFRKP